MSEGTSIGEVYEGANDAALEAYDAVHEEETEETPLDTPEENEEELDDNTGSLGEENEELEDDDTEEVGEAEESEADEADGDVDSMDEEGDPDSKEPSTWDGKPETMPEDLKPHYMNMLRGYNAKMEKVAALQKELQLKLDEASAPEKEAVEERPPMPTSEDSDEVYNDKWAAINAWNAEQAVKKLQGESPGGELAEVKQALEAQRRYTKLTQTDGYTPDVESVMVQIAQENPYWQEQLQSSDDGTFALFQMAKQHVDSQVIKSSAAKQAEEKVKRKVAAGKRKSPRPGGTRKATPAENFADMGFDDLDRLALEQYEASQKK